MSQEERRQTITGLFQEEWDNRMPVEWPNQPFAQPAAAMWARFSTKIADRGDASIGTGHVRTRGIVYLQIFIPQNKGTRNGLLAADAFTAIFDHRSLASIGGEIQFERAKVEEPGTQSDGQYLILCSAPFRHDAFEGDPSPLTFIGEIVIEGETTIAPAP